MVDFGTRKMKRVSADEAAGRSGVPAGSSGKPEKKGLDISARSFVTAIAILFLLMVGTYVLTLVVPGGEYARVPDASGNMVIDTSQEFKSVQGGLPFWQWLFSPVLILGAEGNVTAIAIIVYLLIIGGVFNALEKCGLMRYMLEKIIARFGSRRQLVIAIIPLFFMAWGAMVGSFEECVLLVPVVVALSVGLGYDVLLGLGMSLLADGCGFASGVMNPFTVGVAQTLAGLPVFSGIGMRILSFVLIYALLYSFLSMYARKVARPLEGAPTLDTFVRDRKMEHALRSFVIILGLGLLTVISSNVITVLQDYTMIVMALAFLVAGIVSVLASGAGLRRLGVTFANGAKSLLPAILMILMARSIEYTLEQGHVLDTILHGAVTAAAGLPQWTIVLFIYAVVLVLNFFIASGSAKAFLLIPLIVPVAQIFGISPQLCILAFAFGDGFSNVFYPTNPVLLISLGLVDVSYGKWVGFSWKFQLANLVLTCAILLLGFAIGY